MKVMIRGKRWNLNFVRLNDCLGECDPPSRPNKSIRVDPRQDEEDVLGTIVHEITHAAAWDMSEEFVEEFSVDLARILWRLGYRRLTGDD